METRGQGCHYSSYNAQDNSQKNYLLPETRDKIPGPGSRRGCRGQPEYTGLEGKERLRSLQEIWEPPSE